MWLIVSNSGDDGAAKDDGHDVDVDSIDVDGVGFQSFDEVVDDGGFQNEGLVVVRTNELVAAIVMAAVVVK